MIRKIVQIDEERCNGCGQCATACAEGAIAIIDGKARLVSETYCDGLGACLGECPQDAIAIGEREAAAFDAEAVEEHLAHPHAPAARPEPLLCGCPGTATRAFERAAGLDACLSEAVPSQLGNWPVQLRLVPPTAPYLRGAKLLIAADCAPFAFADFHRRFLADRVLLIGCPKLDDVACYRQKLAQILQDSDIQSIDVVHMEVPCCFGLVQLVAQAVAESGKAVPVSVTKIGIHGEVFETQGAGVGAATRS
jgi:Pyruvate/2-oxoacid:ferredoxin oxidoreductase delta subunit